MAGQEATTKELEEKAAAAEIRIKVIENGLLVKYGPRWYVYRDWAQASTEIDLRIKDIIAWRKCESK